jgi:hypothetical protein
MRIRKAARIVASFYKQEWQLCLCTFVIHMPDNQPLMRRSNATLLVSGISNDVDFSIVTGECAEISEVNGGLHDLVEIAACIPKYR